MLKVVRSNASIEDLLRIWDYHARESVAAADRIVTALNHRIAVLGSFPDMGERQPRHGRHCRRIIEGLYVVYYDRLDDRVLVLRVLHSARRIESLWVR
ncbi:type II toxin-antitoxin system RelE/ParE family toxin [Botrimarina sp.]|uniref:type II toxin-antitoxin system RelE/ParE family toxin n=1 Tax=Botrimarina sp. TaxID=2795802 RepID=UPI0032EE02A5